MDEIRTDVVTNRIIVLLFGIASKISKDVIKAVYENIGDKIEPHEVFNYPGFSPADGRRNEQHVRLNSAILCVISGKI